MERRTVMAADLARNWWVLALRGVLGILFGIAAFVWPESTLTALVLVFGAYVFVDGIFALIAGISMRRQLSLWWLVLLEGVAGIILGLLTFRSPDITALILLSFIAAWSIITGVFEIVTAVRLRKLIPNEWLLIVSGIVSIIFGVLLIAQPGAGAIAIVWLLGAYALLFGILMLLLAFRLRGMRGTTGRQATGAV
jgi:uncharacterized membrane protein HdeD (DUF308 family)